jgi:hypothetical protein
MLDCPFKWIISPLETGFYFRVYQIKSVLFVGQLMVIRFYFKMKYSKIFFEISFTKKLTYSVQYYANFTESC